MKNDYDKLIISDCENSSKIVEYILDYAAADSNYKFGVRFKFHLVPFSYGECTEKLYMNHLERLFHTDPSDSDILYPPPDIADMRELLENQSVDVDTMIVSPDDIAGDLIRLLPEVKQNHNIEGRAAILIIEGDIGLLEIEATAEALESECKTDVLQVGFYKGDILGRVWASLWWFDRRKWSWET